MTKNKFTRYAIVIFAVILSGCVYSSRSPRESFDSHYSWYVGKTIQFFQSGAGRSKVRKILANGNIEEGWGVGVTGCTVYYEYQPQTGLIVAWRVEGEKKNCVQNPYT